MEKKFNCSDPKGQEVQATCTDLLGWISKMLIALFPYFVLGWNKAVKCMSSKAGLGITRMVMSAILLIDFKPYLGLDINIFVNIRSSIIKIEKKTICIYIYIYIYIYSK